MDNRVVIIGGGQAAFSCAAKLRALGDQRPVTIVCGEQTLPYQRPPLSKKYLVIRIPFRSTQLDSVK